MLGRVLRSGAGRVLLLGAGLALVSAASASAATIVTVGQTDSTASVSCTATTWYLQEGSASDVVPAGEWVLTSWSTYMGPAEASLMVFKPTGGGSFQVVGESPMETITTSGVENTYSVLIPVQPGDLIGVYLRGTNIAACASFPGPGSDAPAENAASEPTVGSVVTEEIDIPGVRFDLSATLTPYTPSELCAATEAYVNGSPHSSIHARLAAVQACRALTGGFINVYESDVTQLYDNGWLTATQAANLEAAAADL